MERSPQLPRMSPDSWELIEYRLWHKFSNKLWAIIVGFLTITSIAGLLGIPAYIEKSVEEQVATEKKNFEKLQLRMEKDYVTQIIRANLLNYLFQKYRKESRTFEQAAEQAEREIDQIVDVKIKSSLLKSLRKINSDDFSKDGFKKVIDELLEAIPSKKKQKQDGYNSELSKLSTSEKWEKLSNVLNNYGVDSLYQVMLIHPHLMALKSVMAKNEMLMFKPQLENNELKLQLYDEYEKELYPAYEDELRKYDLPYMMTAARLGDFGWISMWDKATIVFSEYETKIKEEAKSK